LDEYHSRWEKARIGTVKDATIRKQSFEYANAAKTVIDDKGTTFGSIRVIEISAQDVRILQRHLRDEKKPDGSPKYKSNTVNGVMNHVKHILNDAVRERIITWNPFCAVKNLKRTEERPGVVKNSKRQLSLPLTYILLENDDILYHDAEISALPAAARSF